MNVIHLNKHEATGGAAVAAKRLHEGLREVGVDSSMLVERKSTDDDLVRSRSRLPFGASSIARFLLDEIYVRRANGFSSGMIPSRAARTIATEAPDVAHLHWVGDGYLSIDDIGRIDAPIVWTLHDMWPVTGGCHYPGECTRYQETCGSCPVLGSDDGDDLSSAIHRRKRELWDDSSFHLVAPSSWIASRAAESSVLPDTSVTVIPNGIDTDQYCPDPDGGSPIDTDRTTILFGAVSATSDPRKGYDLLTEALQELDDPSSYTCIVFGDEDAELGDVDIPTESFGFLPEADLIRLYAACDVMVVPSRYESFGQTAVEALACGTPVVSFDATGPRDIVTHRETGYLAEPYSTADLRAGIEWVTESADRQRELGAAARRDAVERFDIETVAARYAALYDGMA